MKIKIIKILLLSIVSISIYGNDQAKTSVSQLKQKLSKQIEELSYLKAQINSLEGQLGSANDDYLLKTKEINNIDKKIKDMKSSLNKSALDISNNYEATKKILRHYLMELADERSEDILLKKKIYIKLLKTKMSALEDAQRNSNELLLRVNEYGERLDKSRSDEVAMYNLLVDLEAKKKVLSQKYVSSLEQKNIIDENLEEAIARHRVEKRKRIKIPRSSISITLRKPLENYISAKGSSKGVTFKFDKVTPVYASGNGKIVYAGELASYGKVIMVDHGNEVRSVLLGDISIKVSKGDVVEAGKILAYTNSDPGLTKSLYYEVRKKNIAQNTLKILQKSNTRI